MTHYIDDIPTRDVPIRQIEGFDVIGFSFNNELRCSGNIRYEFWNIHVNFEI